ncbi:MAG TPA: hypothetical protein VNZ52_09770 [Candidatus Thermoplasmatota archaeon]|nr:hypothetical protein [Candidatus Thermoplasmatota archaeon]
MRISEDPTRSEVNRADPNEESKWKAARDALSAPLTPLGIRGGPAIGYSPPDADVYGETAISVALQDLEFPMTREDLLQRAGNWRLPLEPGTAVPLEVVLKETRQERFGSVDEVIHAVRPILGKHHRFNQAAADIPKTEFFRPHGLP